MITTGCRTLLALLPAALVLAGCDTLDRTKDWFSNSGYDSEIDAIEREVPPPAEPFDPTSGLGPTGSTAAGDGRLRTGDGGYVVSTAPPNMTVRLGASVVGTVAQSPATVPSAEADLAAASSETGLTGAADPPPLGYARVRRGSHGTAVAPFRPSPSLR